MSAGYGDAYTRMPVGFGPTPGPRQDNSGKPHDLTITSSVVSTITFKTRRSAVLDLLPKCYTLELGETATCTLNVTRYDNLAWLGGRGYTHLGFYIHGVSWNGEHEKLSGRYLVILFENLADPIISGREELGFAKVFADLTDGTPRSGNDISATAASYGSEFLRIDWTDLQKTDEKPTPYHLFHFKYIPATGELGKSDVAYPTVTPARSSSKSGDTYKAKSAKITWIKRSFKEMPTLHHIVDRLADAEVMEILDARSTVSQGVGDNRDQRRLF